MIMVRVYCAGYIDIPVPLETYQNRIEQIICTTLYWMMVNLELKRHKNEN